MRSTSGRAGMPALFGDEAQMVRGHRIGLLNSAVHPLKRQLGRAGFERLTQSLSLVFGTEAFVVLKDIWGLDRRRAEDVALWTCHALIQAAVAEEGKVAARFRGPVAGRGKRNGAIGISACIEKEDCGMKVKVETAICLAAAADRRRVGVEERPAVCSPGRMAAIAIRPIRRSKRMSKKKWSGLLAGAVFALAGSSALRGGKLTILWAQWDPANYLQELVKDYEKQTGVKVKVETTPWPDFQTKAFREFAAKGDAYDLVVGDSQWLGAGSTAGHYVDLTDFFTKHGVDKSMAPATVEGYAEYPQGQQEVLGRAARRRCDGLVLSQGLVRRPQGNGRVQEEVRL